MSRYLSEILIPTSNLLIKSTYFKTCDDGKRFSPWKIWFWRSDIFNKPKQKMLSDFWRCLLEDIDFSDKKLSIYNIQNNSKVWTYPWTFPLFFSTVYRWGREQIWIFFYYILNKANSMEFNRKYSAKKKDFIDGIVSIVLMWKIMRKLLKVFIIYVLDLNVFDC